MGSAKEVLEIGSGEIVEQENSEDLAKILQEIIDGKNIGKNMKSSEICWEYLEKISTF